MMRFVLFISCIVLLVLSCKKENNSTCPSGLEEGRIIGYDFRECACCGGYWIEVGTDTLRSFTLPEGIVTEDWDIAHDAFEAIPVCLSYTKATNCQMGDELIDIGEMISQK